MSAKALGFKQCGGICTASMGRVPGECAGECGSDVCVGIYGFQEAAC